MTYFSLGCVVYLGIVSEELEKEEEMSFFQLLRTELFQIVNY